MIGGQPEFQRELRFGKPQVSFLNPIKGEAL